MSKPNLIFIITDQQRADTIRANGYKQMHTPNMDALFNRGCTFTNAFCAGATCTPSRAALFTGMYPHNTGCYSFHNWGHQRTWVQDLNDHGYWCSNVGKMHFEPRDVDGGFHERLIVENPTSVTHWGGNGDDAWGKFLSFNGYERPNHRHQTDPHWSQKFQAIDWHLDEALHSDVFVGDSACAYIRSYSEAKPLFMQIGFPGPHEPWDAPQRFKDLYEDVDFDDPIDFETDLNDRPPQQSAIKSFHASCDHESRINMPAATRDDVRRMKRGYYAKISLVDEQIGKVMQALREKGILENSIVVFTSDHGEMLGDHGMAYKWLMYDSILRVPLTIVDFRRQAEPRQVDDLVSLLDIGPTLLDLVDIPKPTRMEGQSLAPYLGGEMITRKRDAVFCEDNYMVCMRTKGHKIVYYIGEETGELYDLQSDPQETTNLWDDVDSRQLLTKLKLELLEWLASSNYHNSGYKCSEKRDGGCYPVRWPRPDDKHIHGSNYSAPVRRHH